MKDVWLRIRVVEADEYPLDCALAQDEYPAQRVYSRDDFYVKPT